MAAAAKNSLQGIVVVHLKYLYIKKVYDVKEDLSRKKYCHNILLEWTGGQNIKVKQFFHRLSGKK